MVREEPNLTEPYSTVDSAQASLRPVGSMGVSHGKVISLVNLMGTLFYLNTFLSKAIGPTMYSHLAKEFYMWSPSFS